MTEKERVMQQLSPEGKKLAEELERDRKAGKDFDVGRYASRLADLPETDRALIVRFASVGIEEAQGGNNRGVFGRLPEDHPLKQEIRRRKVKAQLEDRVREKQPSFKQRNPEAWARESLMKEEGLRRGLDKEQRRNMTIGDLMEGSSQDDTNAGKEDA